MKRFMLLVLLVAHYVGNASTRNSLKDLAPIVIRDSLKTAFILTSLPAAYYLTKGIYNFSLSAYNSHTIEAQRSSNYLKMQEAQKALRSDIAMVVTLANQICSANDPHNFGIAIKQDDGKLVADHIQELKTARQEIETARKAIETARKAIEKINKEEEPLKMAGRFLRHPIKEWIALGTRYNNLCGLQRQICQQEKNRYASSDTIVQCLKVVYRCTSFKIDQNNILFSTEQYDAHKDKIQKLAQESEALKENKTQQYDNIRNVVVPSVDKGIKYSLLACTIYAVLKGTYLL